LNALAIGNRPRRIAFLLLGDLEAKISGGNFADVVYANTLVDSQTLHHLIKEVIQSFTRT